MNTGYLFFRIVSILVFLYVLRLIHNHRLRVGHSWFLLCLGAGLLVFSFWPKTIDWLFYLTRSNSFFDNLSLFLIAFLFVIVVHCSIMISDLTGRVKELAQELALLGAEMENGKENSGKHV